MKRLMSLVFVMGLLLFTVVSVKADSMELKSIESVLMEIRQDQNISSSVPIDLSKVTSARLEELGDSVMEKVIGNTAVHDQMDNALGGDGSASLTRVHVRIGYDYLSGVPITMMSFMGGGMMSYGNRIGGIAYYSQNGTIPGYVSMMSGFGWVWMLLGLLGLVALITAAIHFTSRKSKPAVPTQDDNSMKILKERYARGEITRDDFTRMSELLNK